MNRGSLSIQVAKKSKLSKSQADKVITTTLNSIKTALKKGERVQLIGFGSFWIKNRKARTGRNPRTGESLKIRARKVPAFTAGSALKKAVR
ncbi:MAG: HU family DNA-binding protein [Candidatus Omnitrophota bacterium]|nr:HU family DNA-binding protein [Candidatus Omnitrophota bacterium]